MNSTWTRVFVTRLGDVFLYPQFVNRVVENFRTVDSKNISVSDKLEIEAILYYYERQNLLMISKLDPSNVVRQ